jgi:glycolate oxidase subunit GlcD
MASRSASQIADALLADLEPSEVLTDVDVMVSYLADRATSVVPGTPVAVVRAARTESVQAVMRIASEHLVAVVPRGAGSGLSGGSTAIEGCIVLSTEAMCGIRVDTAALTATVGPGLLNADLKAAAAEVGLWYPPDPSSFEICSIGGNLATNAGGLCCVRYGVTNDYVLGMQVVLADGTAVRLGGATVKNVAGYDLKSLFVGSEGTLGVITEATLRLRPAPPSSEVIVGTFDSLPEAGRAVAAVMTTERPAALELMDRAALNAVEDVAPMGLDRTAAALLLANSDACGDEADRIARYFTDSGATYVAQSSDPHEGAMLMTARRMAIPCVQRQGTVLIEDVGVPLPRIPELLARVQHIAAARETSIPVIGHAGDGNFHPLVTYDAADPDATARAESAFDEIMQAALELGGTITGEHGVGILKAHHLRAQLGDEAMDLNRRIKSALDPHGILNPGKWV